jgi:hypothetical protein
VNDYDIRTYRAYLCDVAQRMKVCAMNHLESLRPEMLLVAPLLTISMFGDSKAASSFSSLTKNAKYGSAGRSLQRPKIWQAKMSASLRMMAALCPISTKEIDRIRGAQPTGWSARGIAWSCAVCRSVVINPPQKIRVALRFWAGQWLDRQPANASFRIKDSYPSCSRRRGAPLSATFGGCPVNASAHSEWFAAPSAAG